MPERRTANISLSPRWQRFIAAKVRAGRYQSASEVVRDGLRLVEERDARHQAAIEELRRQIRVGVAQLDRGEIVDGEAFFDRLRAKGRAARRARR